jgi:aspartate oxidase
MRVLKDEVLNQKIQLLEFCAAVELLSDENGQCTGAIFKDLDNHRHVVVAAKSVILATGGIGRALCLAAAAQGAQLVLLARTERKLRALHAELELLAPGAALMAPFDLEKALAQDYDRIADAIETRKGN